MIRKLILLPGAALIAGALTLASPASAQSAGHILRGGAIGGLGGAAVGALVPGVSVGDGALVGAAGGAAISALSGGHHHRRHYYRGRHYGGNYRGGYYGRNHHWHR